MLMLALESSAKTASAALFEDGTFLGQYFQSDGLTHSCTLLPMAQSLVKNTGRTLRQLGCVAVAHGPGSFTGLRIGVSALKGLAWAKEKPCCGVSTLLAMAQNARAFEGTVICAMDARRSQVYNALFRCESGVLTRLCPDRAIGLAELAEGLMSDPAPKLAVGDGAQLCCDYLTSHGIPCRLAPENIRYQSAVGVALAAEDMARRGETVSGRDLVPTYLRLSQAERERLAKGLKITLE